MTTTDLLKDLGSHSDFAWFVQRLSQAGLPWVVVSSAAVARWTQRDPEGWSKVVQWLDEQGITLVRI